MVIQKKEKTISEHSGESPVSSRVRTGIIGCGCRAQYMMIANEIESPLEILGLYDPVEDSIEAIRRMIPAPGKARVYDSVFDLCSSDEIEAVIIASPANLHMEAVRLASEAGKHILLEKPISNSVSEAREMVEILRGYDKICYLGLQYRECPVIQRVLELLRLGRVGDVKMAQIQELRGPYLPKWKEWNKYTDMSGGTMVEKCCHFFDLFNLVIGSRPTKVYTSAACDVNYADINVDGRPADVVDNAFTIVDYENGARAGLHLCMFSRQNFAGERMTINGDRGTIYADFDGFYIHVGGNQTGDNPEEIHIRPSDAIRNSGHFGADYYQLKKFAEAVRSGNHDLPTFEEGFWSLVVGVAAERSIQTGAPVQISDVM